MKYFVVIMSILLTVNTVNTYGWTLDSGYNQIEIGSDIAIFDENNELIREKTPLGEPKVTLQKGKKYFIKVQIINNGEGMIMGYDSNNYCGKIKFILGYQKGPITKYKGNPVIAEYNDQKFAPMETREYIIPFSLDMFNELPKENAYSIRVSYWDSKHESKGSWKEASRYYDPFNKQKNMTHKYLDDVYSWYRIYLSEEGLKEDFKYYDKEKKRFIKPD